MNSRYRIRLIGKVEVASTLIALAIVLVYRYATGSTLMHAGTLDQVPRTFDPVAVLAMCIVHRIVYFSQMHEGIDARWALVMKALGIAFSFFYGSLYGFITIPITVALAFLISYYERMERETREPR